MSSLGRWVQKKSKKNAISPRLMGCQLDFPVLFEPVPWKVSATPTDLPNGAMTNSRCPSWRLAAGYRLIHSFVEFIHTVIVGGPIHRLLGSTDKTRCVSASDRATRAPLNSSISRRGKRRIIARPGVSFTRVTGPRDVQVVDPLPISASNTSAGSVKLGEKPKKKQQEISSNRWARLALHASFSWGLPWVWVKINKNKVSNRRADDNSIEYRKSDQIWPSESNLRAINTHTRKWKTHNMFLKNLWKVGKITIDDGSHHLSDSIDRVFLSFTFLSL